MSYIRFCHGGYRGTAFAWRAFGICGLETGCSVAHRACTLMEFYGIMVLGYAGHAVWRWELRAGSTCCTYFDRRLGANQQHYLIYAGKRIEIPC